MHPISAGSVTGQVVAQPTQRDRQLGKLIRRHGGTEQAVERRAKVAFAGFQQALVQSAVRRIRLERPSVGLGCRRHKPAASTLSTTLLAPPTVIDNALAMSSTRQSVVAATTCVTSNQASGTPWAC